MQELNFRKFADCLARYRYACENRIWVKSELPKFYFANLLSRRVQLRLQTAEMLWEICQRIEGKNYYYHNYRTKIVGIQFLKETGHPDHSEPITPADIELFKNLASKDSLSEADFRNKKMSFSALSGWLGTLLPVKFMPVTSTLFRHTISYLFDSDLKLFQEDNFDYFLHSQKYFNQTKRKLRELNLDSLYLKDIADYVKFKYPKSTPKTKYDEHDLNWITQDFHLFVFREILGLDSDNKISIFDRMPGNERKRIPGFQTAGFSNHYLP